MVGGSSLFLAVKHYVSIASQPFLINWVLMTLKNSEAGSEDCSISSLGCILLRGSMLSGKFGCKEEGRAGDKKNKGMSSFAHR